MFGRFPRRQPRTQSQSPLHHRSTGIPYDPDGLSRLADGAEYLGKEVSDLQAYIAAGKKKKIIKLQVRMRHNLEGHQLLKHQ